MNENIWEKLEETLLNNLVSVSEKSGFDQENDYEDFGGG